MSETLHILRIPVILNTQAGSGSATEDEIRTAFTAQGLSVDFSNAGAGGKGDLASLVRDCVRRGCPVVVVGGGDGSLHTAAGVLAGTESALGILPVGTLNHFAKDLGIPLALGDAVAVLAAGAVRRVDVGEANGQVFINNASVGLYPSVVRRRDVIRQRLGRSKWTAFAIAVWRALLKYRLLRVRVMVDGRDYDRRTPFVFVGNNSYVMDGLNIGTREALDGGVLSLYMARRENPLRLLLLALRALVGRLKQARDFESFAANAVTVRTRRSREHVGLDGEVVVLEVPIHLTVRPEALRVVAPAA